MVLMGCPPARCSSPVGLPPLGQARSEARHCAAKCAQPRPSITLSGSFFGFAPDPAVASAASPYLQARRRRLRDATRRSASPAPMPRMGSPTRPYRPTWLHAQLDTLPELALALKSPDSGRALASRFATEPAVALSFVAVAS